MSNDEFTYQTMLTCLGNKRKLIKQIEKIVQENILPKLQKEDKLIIFDGFAGSSVVSRSLSQYAESIHTNDLELYATTMAKCFMNKPSDQQKERIIHHIDQMKIIAKNGPYYEGIITKNYSPKDTNNIQHGERCFYTHENGLIIDTLRKYITNQVEPELFEYCISPLLIKASIHANTAGVFKGFYKDKETGIGTFGGSDENALSRITKPIEIEVPIWSEYEFDGYVYNEDINTVIDSLPNDIDLTYLDPPYNQHPYSSNYFMLNLIILNQEPQKISKVSGIPSDWTRSNYNYKDKAIESMKDLITKTIKKSKYILLSYNNEGIIPLKEWDTIFKDYTIEKHEIKYDAYKGSRNLKDRSNKVIEIMYLISE
jgi:adenine-specific DNA-methyltransferase